MSAIKNHYHDEITAGMQSQDRIHDHNWGRADYQNDILKMIDLWEESLHEKDAEGHSWVQTFRFRVTQVKP